MELIGATNKLKKLVILIVSSNYKIKKMGKTFPMTFLIPCYCRGMSKTWNGIAIINGSVFTILSASRGNEISWWQKATLNWQEDKLMKLQRHLARRAAGTANPHILIPLSFGLTWQGESLFSDKEYSSLIKHKSDILKPMLHWPSQSPDLISIKSLGPSGDRCLCTRIKTYFECSPTFKLETIIILLTCFNRHISCSLWIWRFLWWPVVWPYPLCCLAIKVYNNKMAANNLLDILESLNQVTKSILIHSSSWTTDTTDTTLPLFKMLYMKI